MTLACIQHFGLILKTSLELQGSKKGTVIILKSTGIILFQLPQRNIGGGSNYHIVVKKSFQFLVLVSEYW